MPKSEKYYESFYDGFIERSHLTYNWRDRRKKIELPEKKNRKKKYPYQDEFALMVGISRNTYSIQERGDSQPNRENFVKVMQMFDKFGV